MSVTGLFGSGGLLSSILQGTQSNAQKLKQEFQQLGQDLQSGNLSAAQSDFATFQQNSPFSSTSTSVTAGATAATSSTGSTVAKEFQQLGTDLQAGNLTAAQSDFSNIQQTFQSAAQGSGRSHGHHHHHGGGQDSGNSGVGTGSGAGTTATGNSSNPISQVIATLGQALQAGNLLAAQSTYTTLQQDLEQFTQGNGVAGVSGSSGSSSGTSGNSTGVSVDA